MRSPHREKRLRTVPLLFAASPYTVLNADEVLLVDATGGPFLADLPAVATVLGLELTVVKTDVSANAVTLDGNGGETINGAATYVLSDPGDAVTIVAHAAGWQIVSARTQTSAGGGASVSAIQVDVDGTLGNGAQDSTTQLPAGCSVVDAWSDVTGAFSPGTTFQVGTTASATAFMDSTAVDPDLDPTTTALYQKSQRTAVAGASVVRVTLGGGPVAGTAVVLVFYVTPDT